ncbi:ABC transporter permease [Bradyrhizobium sp. U87765 SZCCT0131]|uniref:ABC transporter permease n=1 Tax=unclassified Bradyrhizobium TaxID=2631580 RepID=UPI001BA882D2|nr:MULTISPECIES: ABC transporter permease [unclassified Bradyrhizobium]MBR1219673.1 ABC transporter permease [Bradyrhizobium sp. U87765 SZCCT0131]MBR1262324.1 ABC transporter permease [Bradyrhizobium sp. U87765 SZCCT0134]MBR1308493.1 ABC transporter permease [Bradyrhizobium sp. U87765 SZCCT0110]MBR1318106.1 ABC transporter permease [Bradyrhizobium sp. U87765 SZCCT0109]MBR1351809.1 ABC transporter permease [Bradyrhizobium sp. U87765 SZCCT0048]
MLETVKAKPIYTITATAIPAQAVHDLLEGGRHYEMWWRFALHDIRQRFRRSLIGPFWLTLSMGIMVGAMGLVFSTVFQQDIAGTLPYISVGLILWGFFSTCVNEGSNVFIISADYIRNVPIPLSVHVYRMIARNVIILGFNMTIYVLVLVVFPHPLNWNYLLAIPGFILMLVNVGWSSIAFAVLSARYRDIPQVAASVLQVIFFVTPVFWSAQTLPRRPSFILWNPIYHLLEIVRTPLLGGVPSWHSWAVALGCAVLGCGLTMLLYRRAYPRVAYWV